MTIVKPPRINSRENMENQLLMLPALRISCLHPRAQPLNKPYFWLYFSTPPTGASARCRPLEFLPWRGTQAFLRWLGRPASCG